MVIKHNTASTYQELNNSPINRFRLFFEEKYMFTLGVYPKEMGFFIDFPAFSNTNFNIDNCSIPKSITNNHDVTIKKNKLKFCTKLSFHESGEILFSKTGKLSHPSVRNFTDGDIYNHNGEHVFTIMMQNIESLTKRKIKNKKDTSLVSLSSKNKKCPKTLKFVGNIWNEKELLKALPSKDSFDLKRRIMLWPREGSNLKDIVIITKLCHLKNKDPLYITVRTIPMELSNKDIKKPILVVTSGWKFSEMKDGKNKAKFIGMIGIR